MKCINYAWREGHYENRDRLIELIKQLDTLNDNKQYKSNGNLVAMLYLETEYNLGVYEKEYLENAIERYQYFSDEVKNEEVINYLYALCLELNGNIETAENIYAGLDWRSDANIACRYLICKLSRNDYAEAVKVYKEYNSSEINTKLKSLYLTAVYYDDTDNYLDMLKEALDEVQDDFDGIIDIAFGVHEKRYLIENIVPLIKKHLHNEIDKLGFMKKTELISVLAHAGDLELILMVMEAIVAEYKYLESLLYREGNI